MPGLLATVRIEVAALDVSRRSLTRFGLLVGSVLLALAGVAAWRAGSAPGPLGQGVGGVGTLLVLGGLAVPRALAGVYRVWMAAGIVLGFVMTRVILTAAFVLVFTPVGLLFRLLRRDLLDQRPDARAASYWIRRTDGPSSRERLERMY